LNTKHRRLLLHIGPHKTGTTAIQQALLANENKLKAEGWYVERLPSLKGGVHQLADWLSQGNFAQSAPYLKALHEDNDNVVISSENFSRMRIDQIHEFASLLDFPEVQIVYYLRNPLDRLISNWQEKVKHGYRHSFLEGIASRLAQPFLSEDLNPGLHLSAWGKVFGHDNLKIRLYDRVSDVVSDFFETHLGISEVVTPGRSVNKSNSTLKNEVLRSLVGYQWHLLHSKDFNKDVDEIGLALQEAKNKRGHSYAQQFSMSWDSGILKTLETQLMNDFAFHDEYLGRLFEKRVTNFEFFGSEVWLESTELYEKSLALRMAIHEKFGVPTFDHRLDLL
jgi:hypothetical protein